MDKKSKEINFAELLQNFLNANQIALTLAHYNLALYRGVKGKIEKQRMLDGLDIFIVWIKRLHEQLVIQREQTISFVEVEIGDRMIAAAVALDQDLILKKTQGIPLPEVNPKIHTPETISIVKKIEDLYIPNVDAVFKDQIATAAKLIQDFEELKKSVKTR